MDEFLLDRVKQLAEIEERISRILAGTDDESLLRRSLVVLMHELRDMLRRAEEEYRAF